MNALPLAKMSWSLIPMVMLPLLAALPMVSGCTPVLEDLDPLEGPPGTVVEVKGSRLFGATVRWDANTPSEQTLPSGFLGARFFTVPLEAEPREYPVRLYGGGDYSVNEIQFKVVAGVVRPAPRLDDVTVSKFSIDSEGKASMVLMAHGANIDVGAQIIMDETPVMSFFSRLLRNGAMNASDPSTLGYPIFHYATIWCFTQNQVPDSDISVAVKNLDGATSNTLTYHIAASMEELDSDGDGLPDVWEKDGYGSVDLPALGAKPLRKDLFVEVDWMRYCKPDEAMWTYVKKAFARAPILNSDGSQGIAIHIDRGGTTGDGGGNEIDCPKVIIYDTEPRPDTVSFHELKEAYFELARLNVYRYCIFAWESGHGDGGGKSEGILCNDFFISLHGSYPGSAPPVRYLVGAFMHELGHTLGLRHGGADNTDSKDNYNSVMQYGNCADLDRNESAKYTPDCGCYFCSPGMYAGIDVDCDLGNTDAVYTYSQGQRDTLDETGLNENVGLCDNKPINWDGHGPYRDDVSVNLDLDDEMTIITDFPDWANVELDFRQEESEWEEN
ncbi:MAG: hypothetical protein JSW03_07995 [Candidatus Eiseniibacteriota bacterium]|nr:MAG: hypothetical protein JSW03_07995 [Candidatus Eisenbacteria bacterium]